MIEALKGDEIVRKVGGRFKVAVLMQKRMVDIAFGAPLMVERGNRTLMEAIVQEILEDKISLDTSSGLMDVETEEEAAPEEGEEAGQ